MIRGVHSLFYTSEPEALRAFIRDKLGFTAHDVSDGWLIFDVPEGDMGCHPTDGARGGPPSGKHAISFYCDNLEQTIAELRARGVEFTAPVSNEGWGLVTYFKVPGDFEIQLYQPLYTKS